MNPRQITAFRATMRSGSITGAAKLLFVSQPSVSRLIADLEIEVGFPLFTRTGHGLVATLEARRFFHSVERMFIGLDKLKETAEAIRMAKDEMVCFGVIPIFASSVMPKAIRLCKQQQNDLRLEIFVKNTPEIVDAVLLQQLDLGMICPTHQYEGIHIIHQQSVPYRCLVPTSHPKAHSEARSEAGPGNHSHSRRKTKSRSKNGCHEIDLETLLDEEVIALDPDYLERVCDEPEVIKKIRPNIRIIAHSDPAIASIAAATQSLAIVDPYTARIAESQGDMISLPIKQRLNYPIAIIARGKDTLSLASTRLAGSLIKSLTEPMDQSPERHSAQLSANP